MYELFDHTADLGLRVRAADFAALLTEAAGALTAAMVARPAAVRPLKEQAVRIEGTARDELLVDWLSELLFLFAARSWIGCRFQVSVQDDGLQAAIRGETFDAVRHGCGQELKAITYHQLRVEQDEQGWIAEVVIDL